MLKLRLKRAIPRTGRGRSSAGPSDLNLAYIPFLSPSFDSTLALLYCFVPKPSARNVRKCSVMGPRWDITGGHFYNIINSRTQKGIQIQADYLYAVGEEWQNNPKSS